MKSRHAVEFKSVLCAPAGAGGAIFRVCRRPRPAGKDYDESVSRSRLIWESKLVLLLVLPLAAANVVLEGHWWAVNAWPVAIWTLGLSLLLGLAVFQLGAVTPDGAFTGAVITASLMFSTATFIPFGSAPYAPWHTALVPLLAVFILTAIATRLGREGKQRLGTAESRQGRTAAQVAANLGVAMLAFSGLAQFWFTDSRWFSSTSLASMPLFVLGLAALAEAAADTVSSEIGQILCGRPRMITTLRTVEAGTDGAISLTGTLAGAAAAVIVAAIGTPALGGSQACFWISCAGGVFGLFFDSLLGATLERRGWLNNDMVNFLSTAGAAALALGLLALLTHSGMK